MQNLQQLEAELEQSFAQLKRNNLNLDLTRGKPSSEQLDLSNAIDGILATNYSYHNTDMRNYGGINGLEEMRALFAQILNTPLENIIVGGNSSLTLMHQTLMFANFFSLFEGHKPWAQQEQASKFICPVPGYDRHFKLCESLGIEMINVAMREDGPDMDQVEALVKADSGIKGMWNVPRFSNPTGIVYSNSVVQRIAALPQIAAADFLVLWDNAYALHSFTKDAPHLASLSQHAATLGTENHIIEYTSTSKITFSGAGIAAMAAGTKTLARFKQYLEASTIGPDKVNQLRHLRFFPDFSSLEKHMAAHATLLEPRFATVLSVLDKHLDASMGSWTRPQGGYFISFDTQPGQAQQVIQLCAEAGVKMTSAGATFPYGKDPQNSNIRIAPSFASLEEIETAMEVFAICVKLVNVRQQRTS